MLSQNTRFDTFWIGSVKYIFQKNRTRYDWTFRNTTLSYTIWLSNMDIWQRCEKKFYKNHHIQLKGGHQMRIQKPAIEGQIHQQILTWVGPPAPPPLPPLPKSLWASWRTARLLKLFPVYFVWKTSFFNKFGLYKYFWNLIKKASEVKETGWQSLTTWVRCLQDGLIRC